MVVLGGGEQVSGAAFASSWHCARLPQAEKVNAALVGDFEHLWGQEAGFRKSHFFEGRFENLYVDREAMPALEPVLSAAAVEAGRLLDVESSRLGVGFWFNAMQPGHVTVRHSHDDDDELLSGVYYAQVPLNSGDLVLFPESGPAHWRPQAGEFLFFGAALEHEVLVHQGEGLRLSIGMNFGVR